MSVSVLSAVNLRACPPSCHPERSEGPRREVGATDRGEVLRCAQDDKVDWPGHQNHPEQGARLRALLVALLLLSSVTLAFAQERAPAQGSPFVQGNALYSQGNYEGARQQYLAQLQQGPVTAALLYNLGNTCFQTGQVGWALVYYERALLAAPRDRDLRANHALALSTRRVSASTEAPGWAQVLWHGVLDRATLNELALLALLAYLLSCVLVIRWLRGTLFRRRYQWLLWLVLALLVLFASLAISKAVVYHNPHRAVIVADGELMSGPADSFQALRKTYQGELVRLVGQQGMWREVVFESGARGFVAQTQVEPVAGRTP